VGFSKKGACVFAWTPKSSYGNTMWMDPYKLDAPFLETLGPFRQASFLFQTNWTICFPKLEFLKSRMSLHFWLCPSSTPTQREYLLLGFGGPIRVGRARSFGLMYVKICLKSYNYNDFCREPVGKFKRRRPREVS